MTCLYLFLQCYLPFSLLLAALQPHSLFAVPQKSPHFRVCCFLCPGSSCFTHPYGCYLFTYYMSVHPSIIHTYTHTHTHTQTHANSDISQEITGKTWIIHQFLVVSFFLIYHFHVLERIIGLMYLRIMVFAHLGKIQSWKNKLLGNIKYFPPVF